uniref:J domain-containing protein n=1 Tax=Salix viminalis TaxID=40686 RepID=A0A6N2KPJ7_SALVM
MNHLSDPEKRADYDRSLYRRGRQTGSPFVMSAATVTTMATGPGFSTFEVATQKDSAFQTSKKQKAKSKSKNKNSDPKTGFAKQKHQIHREKYKFLRLTRNLGLNRNTERKNQLDA